MSPHTAKAIKELVNLLGRSFVDQDGRAVRFYTGTEPVLEKLLHEFAENVRTDTQEP